MQSHPEVRIENLVKTFGEISAVNNVSLDIPAGTFTTLLGPSGCGKTTLLRIIAGFEQPDSGDVFIQGQLTGSTPPHARDTSMVFQSYALFPHMNVEQNVAFGLRERGLSESEITKRVSQALDLIDLSGFGNRKTTELSGGQQQRVALARSLVVEPTVLLLDEPLGALDLQLRRQMQTELKRIQQQLGITFIYVTHDQEEALTMSDRIIVMRAGVIEQEGSPEEIYKRPISRYVAEFMGAENVLPVEVEPVDSQTVAVHLAGSQFQLPIPKNEIEHPHLMIRAEHVKVNTEYGWRARIVARVFKGSVVAYQLEMEDGTQIFANSNESGDARLPGENVRVDFRPDNAILVHG